MAALALVVLIGFPVLAPPSVGTPVGAPTPEAPPPLPTPTKSFSEPPGSALSPDQNYAAVLGTPRGTIRADLFAREAPTTVNNFVFLARQAFYNGLPVYRVEPDLRVEMGALNEDGTGGPGYSLPPETSPRPHDVGVLAMVAQPGATIASQFLIALADQPTLGPAYTVFGRVTDGLDVARQLRPGDRITNISITETQAQ